MRSSQARSKPWGTQANASQLVANQGAPELEKPASKKRVSFSGIIEEFEYNASAVLGQEDLEHRPLPRSVPVEASQQEPAQGSHAPLGRRVAGSQQGHLAGGWEEWEEDEGVDEDEEEGEDDFSAPVAARGPSLGRSTEAKTTASAPSRKSTQQPQRQQQQMQQLHLLHQQQPALGAPSLQQRQEEAPAVAAVADAAGGAHHRPRVWNSNRRPATHATQAPPTKQAAQPPSKAPEAQQRGSRQAAQPAAEAKLPAGHSRQTTEVEINCMMAFGQGGVNAAGPQEDMNDRLGEVMTPGSAFTVRGIDTSASQMLLVPSQSERQPRGSLGAEPVKARRWQGTREKGQAGGAVASHRGEQEDLMQALNPKPLEAKGEEESGEDDAEEQRALAELAAQEEGQDEDDEEEQVEEDEEGELEEEEEEEEDEESFDQAEYVEPRRWRNGHYRQEEDEEDEEEEQDPQSNQYEQWIDDDPWEDEIDYDMARAVAKAKAKAMQSTRSAASQRTELVQRQDGRRPPRLTPAQEAMAQASAARQQAFLVGRGGARLTAAGRHGSPAPLAIAGGRNVHEEEFEEEEEAMEDEDDEVQRAFEAQERARLGHGMARRQVLGEPAARHASLQDERRMRQQAAAEQRQLEIDALENEQREREQQERELREREKRRRREAVEAEEQRRLEEANRRREIAEEKKRAEEAAREQKRREEEERQFQAEIARKKAEEERKLLIESKRAELDAVKHKSRAAAEAAARRCEQEVAAKMAALGNGERIGANTSDGGTGQPKPKKSRNHNMPADVAAALKARSDVDRKPWKDEIVAEEELAQKREKLKEVQRDLEQVRADILAREQRKRAEEQRVADRKAQQEAEAAQRAEELHEPDERPHLHVAILGHERAGKSILYGAFLQDIGCWDARMQTRHRKDLGLQDTEARRYSGAETQEARLTLLDVPGNWRCLPLAGRMLAEADVALLVVSAKGNEFDKAFEDRHGPLREHALMAKGLGARCVIVAVNKMEEVQWSEARFSEICTALSDFLSTIGFTQDDVCFVPVDGLSSEFSCSKAPWHTKGGLLQCITAASSPGPEVADLPLRVMLLEASKEKAGIVVVEGRVECGTVKPGQEYAVSPSGASCTVQAVRLGGQNLYSAGFGEAVQLRLQGVENVASVPCGSILSSPDEPVRATQRIIATLDVLELPQDRPVITVGSRAIVHVHAASTDCEIVGIEEATSLSTGEREQKPRIVRSFHRARFELRLFRVVAIDEHCEGRGRLGLLALRTEDRTIAVGHVLEVC